MRTVPGTHPRLRGHGRGTAPRCEPRSCGEGARACRNDSTRQTSEVVAERMGNHEENPEGSPSALLLMGIIALASTLAVKQIARTSHRNRNSLPSSLGPTKEPLMDCPLSTLDKNQALCMTVTDVGEYVLQFRVNLLSRDGGRVLLGIRTRTVTEGSRDAQVQPLRPRQRTCQEGLARAPVNRRKSMCQRWVLSHCRVSGWGNHRCRFLSARRNKT